MTKNKSVTVSEIVEKYLKKNGYDGLCSYECGCRMSSLFPCGGQQICVPGKYHKKDKRTKVCRECGDSCGCDDGCIRED